MRFKILLIGFFLLIDSTLPLYSGDQSFVAESVSIFLYTARKWGIPILEAKLRIENGSSEQGKPFYQIEAHVNSLNYIGFLFRMKNHFVSIVERETLSPIKYIKEIDQEGFLIKKKRYIQISTFDLSRQKVIIEKGEEKQEVSIPYKTSDPLSIFARYYFGEGLLPDQEVPLSLFDGKRLRQMILYTKKEKVDSKVYKEVEAIRVESRTSFSSFGEKEGRIKIWYKMNGRRVPILMELELPFGNIRFELEEVKEG